MKSKVVSNYRGAFFTPKTWVLESYKILENSLSSSWINNYKIWDCCCGLCNLTRYSNFTNLFCSTIDLADVKKSINLGYSNNAKYIFQYDFLNDDNIVCFGNKIPDDLKNGFENKSPFLFFINPPYGTPASGAPNTPIKKGISNNRVAKEMVVRKLGKSSLQMYAQFLYKILRLKEYFGLTELSIGIFSKSIFMSGSAFKKFRDLFYANFQYVDGMLFNAASFQNVSDKWGISFTLWRVGKNKSTISLRLKRLKENLVKEIGRKVIYNADLNSASDWVKKEIRNKKTFDAPQLQNPFVVKNKGKNLRGSLTKNAIGYFLNVSNNVITSSFDVGLFSSCVPKGCGVSIETSNFEKVIALFAVRKLVKRNWVNSADEFLVPDISHPDYKQWNYDALIYCLFNNFSQQSSLRKVEYKQYEWNIKNNFFFLSNKEMRNLADKYYRRMYKDAVSFPEERFIYNYLQNIVLSKDVYNLLEKARNLVRISVIDREKFDITTDSKYYLYTWDAGYIQLKFLWKKYYRRQFNDFKKKYWKFEEKLREGVYKFGFLKK